MYCILRTMARMTGTVRDGVVVLDQPVDLPDGTPVLVEVARDIPARDWLARFAGLWKDDAGIDAWVRERSRERRSPNEPMP